MEIILLEKIANLGGLGDKVNVKSGYGRNFLIPQGKAAIATAEKLAEFEQRRVGLEKKAAEILAAAETRAAKIEALTVTITQKAGEEGKLFGSVGTQDIADAITEAGVAVEKQEVRLPDGVLRHTGEFEIDLHFHTDAIASVKLHIEAE